MGRADAHAMRASSNAAGKLLIAALLASGCTSPSKTAPPHGADGEDAGAPLVPAPAPVDASTKLDAVSGCVLDTPPSSYADEFADDDGPLLAGDPYALAVDADHRWLYVRAGIAGRRGESEVSRYRIGDGPCNLTRDASFGAARPSFSQWVSAAAATSYSWLFPGAPGELWMANTFDLPWRASEDLVECPTEPQSVSPGGMRVDAASVTVSGSASFDKQPGFVLTSYTRSGGRCAQSGSVRLALPPDVEVERGHQVIGASRILLEGYARLPSDPAFRSSVLVAFERLGGAVAWRKWTSDAVALSPFGADGYAATASSFWLVGGSDVTQLDASGALVQQRTIEDIVRGSVVLTAIAVTDDDRDAFVMGRGNPPAIYRVRR